MRALGGYALGLAVLCGLAFWWVTRPEAGIAPESLAALNGNAGRGELIFHIGGCAACHAQPQSEGAKSPGGLPLLSGGKRLETPFGVFVAPNITPDAEQGIGRWSQEQFANALLRGVSPDGRHYYPAFPYPSYARSKLQDVVDLKAYLDTLPADARANEPHQLVFPFSIRRGIGLWKRLYLDRKPVLSFDKVDTELLRGQYLVEGPGHCGECHTPRNFMGGPNLSRWLAGAPNLDGDGKIPNITPDTSGIAEWDEADIIEYLTSGFTPEYDVAGSSMADVIENTAQLPEQELAAIARYLRQVPAVRAEQ